MSDRNEHQYSDDKHCEHDHILHLYFNKTGSTSTANNQCLDLILVSIIQYTALYLPPSLILDVLYVHHSVEKQGDDGVARPHGTRLPILLCLRSLLLLDKFLVLG